MARLTTKALERYVGSRVPVLKLPQPRYAMARPDIEPITYNGKKIRGKVVCEGVAIDALRGFGYCKLTDKDEKETYILAGWVVDLDPTKPDFWEPLPDEKYPVRYAFCFRKDALDEVNIEIPEIRSKLEEAASKAGEHDYVCIKGIVYNPTVYDAEKDILHPKEAPGAVRIERRAIREIEEIEV